MPIHDRQMQPHRRRRRRRPPTAPRSSAATRPTRRQVVSVAPESTAEPTSPPRWPPRTEAGPALAADDAARHAPTSSPRPAASLRPGRPSSPPSMVAEEGKPLADARMEAGRTPKNLELYAGEALRLTGATFPSDDDTVVWTHPRSRRRGRGDHAVELPAQPRQPQDRPGAGRREHRRLQAVADDAADGRAAGGRVRWRPACPPGCSTSCTAFAAGARPRGGRAGRRR